MTPIENLAYPMPRSTIVIAGIFGMFDEVSLANARLEFFRILIKIVVNTVEFRLAIVFSWSPCGARDDFFDGGESIIDDIRRDRVFSGARRTREDD